jgi:ATP-dependent protease ClpP protease subunit
VPNPRWRWSWDWLDEALILKSVFRLLLAGALIVVALDFKEIYERSNAALPGDETQREPVVMEPPRRSDQVRTYLPRAMPVRRKSDGPNMPGLAKPPADKSVGERMHFVRGPKGRASAIGRIEPGTATELAQFVEEQAGEIKTLYLHSPGGFVDDALQMSRLLREKDIVTTVPNDGYCASSCPIVFAGGKERVSGPRAWIGVHQIYAAENSPGNLHDGMSHGQVVSAQVQDHLLELGVDPRAWIKAMQTPAEQIYIFTPDELTEYKLATRIGSP